LGYRGIDEIKNHPWFSEIKWERLLEKKIKGRMKILSLNPYCNSNNI